MAKPRKRAVRAVIWAALFSGAVAAGLWVAAAVAPERIRLEAERSLGEFFGTAQVGSVSMGWSGGPALVARSIEVAEDDEVVLILDRAELGLDLMRVFRGEGRFDRLEVSGLSLHVRRLADGSLRPRRLNQWLGESREPPRGRGDTLRVVEIREGRLVLSDEGATPSQLEFDEIELRVEFQPALQIDVNGRMERSPFRVHAVGPIETPAFQVSVENTDLARLRPWLEPALPESSEIEGELAFDVRGNAREGEIRFDRFDAEIAAGSLAGRPLPALRVEGALVLAPDELRLDGVRLSVDALVVHAEATLPRNPGPSSVFAGTLATQRIDLDTLLDQAESLGLEKVSEPLSRLASGVIDSLLLSAKDLSWEHLQAWAEAPQYWPQGLELVASFHDIAMPLDEGEPLQGLGGRIELASERLALREIHAMLGDRPLPSLDMTIEGWSRLAEAHQGPGLHAVPPLRGREALMQWIETIRTPEPGWRSARIELDWLDHPALLRPLERTAATLRPLQPGIAVDLHGARWGGVWLSGEGLLSGEHGEQRIELRLQSHSSAPKTVGDRVTSVVRNAATKRSGSAWSAGRASVELRKLGAFAAKQLALNFVADGTQLRSEDVAIRLEPRGDVGGRVEMELGVADEVPYRTSFQLSDAELSSVLEALGARGTLTDGHLVLAADLRGRLRAGEKMLDSLRGPITAHSRDGVVRRRVPWALAIAEVSETFNPFRSRETLSYDAIDGNFRLEEGRVDGQSITVTGPTLRLVATGALHLETPNRLEAVVGLFFFRGIDKVIGSVPILNTLLLGSDENLVPAYFSFEGPWAAPKARLIPMKSFLAGPASIVAEGVPSFVRGGLNRLGRLFSLTPSEAASKSSEDPAEAAP